MKRKGVLTKAEYEKLSVEAKADYLPQEGGENFVIDLELPAGYEIRDTSGFTQTIQTLRGELKTANTKLSAFAGIDDVEAAKTKLAKFDEMSKWTPQDQLDAKIKAREDQITANHQRELNAEKAANAKLRSVVQTSILKSRATTAIGDKAPHRLALPIVLPYLQTEEKDGEFVVTVIDPTTKHERLNKKNQPMTPEELIEELSADKDVSLIFRPTQGAGAGLPAGGGGGSPGGKKVIEASDQRAVSANVEAISKGTVIVK